MFNCLIIRYLAVKITSTTTTINGGSSSSHAWGGSGYLIGLNSTNTFFPIGSYSGYQPCRISNGGGQTYWVKPGLTPADSPAVVTASWNITTPSVLALSTNITLHWLPSAENVDFGFDNSNCHISLKVSDTWTDQSGNAAAIDEADGTRSRTATNVGLFGNFAVASGSALPVTLLNFRAEENDSRAILTWQTAMETHNKGFDVEKSTDLQTFKSIGFIDGVGESVQLHNYRFIDTEFAKLSYYRLKQIDTDGTTAYSKVVSLQPQANLSTWAVYPNPSKNKVLIVGNEAVKQLNVFDAFGKKITETFADNLDIDEWQTGIYFVHIQTDMQRIVKKIVKK